ncbi:hypothetical protein MRB53_036312 [Persea americana]|nr:hypothetical protein MRB53_039269 [Persea americana]KAJ8613962.1 hypothetical protein MRB53_036753 [Persea americana]KAJ8614180.1 hypothetical protein MRB53_036656 [Persea americana]KAJ8614762.1 hypothetical protein MRB53_036428 [Persea americana]KAJ8614899.1 hypothetical protein MRB53_036312 [Persea americana]
MFNQQLQPMQQFPIPQQQESIGQGRRQDRPRREFTDLGKPLSQVLPVLVEQGLLVPLQPRPHPDPLPKNFDPHAKCLYHQNNGHWTDRCWPLRHAIQDLIDKGKSDSARHSGNDSRRQHYAESPPNSCSTKRDSF